MFKRIYFLAILCLFACVTQAQKNAESKQVGNELSHLLATEDVVYQLRKNYGIHGSVLLSKTLAQILNSFSNQKQAINTWQATIDELSATKAPLQLATSNPQYNYGQILTRYTHGMNQAKWYKNRKKLTITKKNLKMFFATYDNLTIYFNLQQVWEILLNGITKQDNIQWHEVFAQSLNLFTDKNNRSSTTNLHNKDFFKSLKSWQKSAEMQNDLADLIKTAETSKKLPTLLYQDIIRFILQKRQQNYLMAAISWLSAAQQLYLHKVNLTAQEKHHVIKLIKENQSWFLASEQKISAINIALPNWLKVSFNDLIDFYHHAGASQNVTLPTIYQLLEPELDKYMTSAFRKKVQTNLEVCLNISEELAPYPQEPIDNKQYKGCINDFTNWATKAAISNNLAGSLSVAKSTDNFDNAIKLPAWQLINTIYANSASKDCIENYQQLANPLEWSLAVESLFWFVDRWPAYFKASAQPDAFAKIIQHGEDLVNNFTCLEKSKTDTLNTYFTQIVQQWQNVKNQIKQVIIEYNNNNLATDSDIDLIETSEKPSNYRVVDMKISACDAQNSCGIHVELEASRALFGLFPNHLLIAAQLKLEQLKLCYDNVGWENRRATSTHLDNNNVANYLGNFSFSLKGFYADKLVFAKKLIDTNEYFYLFAANTPEILATSCPLSIIGSKISTKLARGTYGLVPNRLTFLTASRASEVEILTSNWSVGAEWNNAIVDDKVPYQDKNELTELVNPIQQAYQQKADELQVIIYNSMLNKQANATEPQQKLAASFISMQRANKLFSSMNFILQMDNFMSNDDLHSMFYGINKIPNANSIDKLLQNQLNINLLIENIDNNLKLNQQKWNALEKSWSNQHILDILFRLNTLIE